MLDILLCGCCGHMGKIVAECASEHSDEFAVAAGVDVNDDGSRTFPVYRAIENVSAHADVIIDFSNPALLEGILAYSVKHKLPAVIATTGLSEEQKKLIRKTAETVPVFYTANMSLGVNVICELVKSAVSALGADFDIEIIEKHHRRKLDAPSGTALMLADAASEALGMKSELVYDRHSVRRARTPNEIGISSVRGGTIVGEHDVIFAGDDEIITISHSAGSRRVFASGALRAAEFISGKGNGLFDMSAMIKSHIIVK